MGGGGAAFWTHVSVPRGWENELGASLLRGGVGNAGHPCPLAPREPGSDDLRLQEAGPGLGTEEGEVWRGERASGLALVPGFLGSPSQHLCPLPYVNASFQRRGYETNPTFAKARTDGISVSQQTPPTARGSLFPFRSYVSRTVTLLDDVSDFGNSKPTSKRRAVLTALPPEASPWPRERPRGGGGGAGRSAGGSRLLFYISQGACKKSAELSSWETAGNKPKAVVTSQ